MSAEIQYFNRTDTGLSNFYVLLFDGSNVANGGGLTDIEFSWSDTVVRANVLQLVDTNHLGVYLADMLEGVPAGRYTPVVFQSSGDPATTATTTDALIERQAAIQWDGAAVVSGDTGTGSGSTPIDHDGGDGVTVDGDASATDILQYLNSDSSGADGLFISAYLASEYDASPPLRSAKGTTRTGSDGRWLAPLMLDAGMYYIVADSPADNYQAQINTVVVP